MGNHVTRMDDGETRPGQTNERRSSKSKQTAKHASGQCVAAACGKTVQPSQIGCLQIQNCATCMAAFQDCQHSPPCFLIGETSQDPHVLRCRAISPAMPGSEASLSSWGSPDGKLSRETPQTQLKVSPGSLWATKLTCPKDRGHDSKWTKEANLKGQKVGFGQATKIVHANQPLWQRTGLKSPHHRVPAFFENAAQGDADPERSLEF